MQPQLCPGVAQIVNLPYRRLAIGRAWGNSCRVTLAHTPQNAILPIQQIDNLRYVTVFVPQYT